MFCWSAPCRTNKGVSPPEDFRLAEFCWQREIPMLLISEPPGGVTGSLAFWEGPWQVHTRMYACVHACAHTQCMHTLAFWDGRGRCAPSLVLRAARHRMAAVAATSLATAGSLRPPTVQVGLPVGLLVGLLVETSTRHRRPLRARSRSRLSTLHRRRRQTPSEIYRSGKASTIGRGLWSRRKATLTFECVHEP